MCHMSGGDSCTVSFALIGSSFKEVQSIEVSFSFMKLSALMPLLDASKTEIIWKKKKKKKEQNQNKKSNRMNLIRTKVM